MEALAGLALEAADGEGVFRVCECCLFTFFLDIYSRTLSSVICTIGTCSQMFKLYECHLFKLSSTFLFRGLGTL